MITKIKFKHRNKCLKENMAMNKKLIMAAKITDITIKKNKAMKQS
jgi:hypothetical protein